jgi:predicted N-acetyltransferase YhbS
MRRVASQPGIVATLHGVAYYRRMASAMADDRIAIRRARPGDSAAVRVLVTQLGYEPHERSFDETFAQVARHPEAAVFVACQGPRVVGYLSMTHRPQIRLGGIACAIDELAVDTNLRNSGLGSELRATAVAHAKSLHCTRIEVLCSRALEAHKRGFYEQRGFAEVETAVYRLVPT